LTANDNDHRGETLDLPQGTFDAPDVSAEEAMLNALVERALSLLTKSQREIVMLRDIEGFENDEIAHILQWNLKQGAIRKRVFDAREAFRRAMLQLGYREE
jgi:DNA-directed RNA polymerase specialized sigma24 family protein